MIKKLFFTRNSSAAFSRRQVFRAMVWMWVIGLVSAGVFAYYASPAIAQVSAYFEGIGTVEVHNQIATSTQSVDPEKIDRYTEEEYEKNQKVFNDYARFKAIERVEAELEVEKETLRASELEGLSFE